MAEPSQHTGLYAITSASSLIEQPARTIELCRSVSIAALLISGPETAKPDDVRNAIAEAQGAGIAVLLQNQPQAAKDLAADGVHLPHSKTIVDDYRAARQILGPGLIVGADAGKSRHDALTLGEAGADYVAFGIPAFVRDRESAFNRQIELVSWWAELVEVPVVAFDVENEAAAGAFAKAGADFIAITLPPLSASSANVAAWQKHLRHLGESAALSQ